MITKSYLIWDYEVILIENEICLGYSQFKMKSIETGRLIIVENIAAANNLFYLKIKIGKNAGNFAPGNFVSILPPASSGRFLRRPFSVAGISDDSIELIIKSIGPVTKSLVSLTEGSEIEIMGPLGNKYQIPGNIKKLWMIGGGTGIASLLFLNSLRSCESLSKSSSESSFEKSSESLSKSSFENDKVLWAGKTKEQLPSIDIFSNSRKEFGKESSNIFRKNIFFATDDGSTGEKGTAPEVLEQWLKNDKEQPDGIVSCGPHGMMKEIKKIADNRGIPAWFSLEEFMACGTGACAGCAVASSAGGYLKVCSDGPVFSGALIKFDSNPRPHVFSRFLTENCEKKQ